MNDCKHAKSSVYDSRANSGGDLKYDIGNCTLRRRECMICGERFITYELKKEALENLIDRIIDNSEDKTMYTKALSDFITWARSLPDEGIDKRP